MPDIPYQFKIGGPSINVSSNSIPTKKLYREPDHSRMDALNEFQSAPIR